ncbi:MAG: DUF4115 domain-containing protein [Nocardioides sp.]|nr:DUF4115 domain-containing protein [Nocardioides sp.]
MSTRTDGRDAGHADHADQADHWVSADPEQDRDATWEVRRRSGLSALLGVAAAGLALGFLVRAVEVGSLVDGVVCAVLTFVAAYHLSAFVDGRTPLVVADDLGVRLRFGTVWRGLPWESLDRVVLLPARSRLREDRLVLVPADLDTALAGLDSRARRQARLAQAWYGAPLAVPLGMTVRVAGNLADRDPAAALTELSDGRCPVVTLLADTATALDPEPEPAPADEVAGTTPRSARLAAATGRLATFVSRVGRGRHQDVDSDTDRENRPSRTPSAPLPPLAPAASATPVPLRPTQSAVRAEVVAESTWGATALARDHAHDDADDADGADRSRGDLPEGRVLRRQGSVDLFHPAAPEPMNRVTPIAQAGEPVAPVVIDDLARPAHDPVIGPEVAAARTRLGLSVDDLAARTRIRPHVLESVEVDDFAPCGGDVYARGHLRTIARVLGKSSDPWLAAFDARYAHAPIDARRVFEAELATGMTGSMRRTTGGPNWVLMAAAVLSLALVWGVARLVAGDPATYEVPSPTLDGSAGLTRVEIPPATAMAEPVPVVLTATADSRVVVRDGEGNVLFRGPMVLGERKRLAVPPPVRLRASVPGVVEVSVRGRDRGVLGETDSQGPAVRRYR